MTASPETILLISALPPEIAGLRRRGAVAWSLPARSNSSAEDHIDGGFELAIPGGRMVGVSLGMGRAAIERRLPPILDALRPTACVMVGFAGGCHPTLRTGDLVVGNPLLCEPDAGPGGAPIAGREPISLDPLTLKAVSRAAVRSGRPVTEAIGVTVNVIATPRAKDSLWRNRGAFVCEMENFWAARACHRAGVPFVAVRVVFDRAHEALPDIPPTGLAGVLLRRPSLLKHLPGLGLRFWKARRALDPYARALVAEMLAVHAGA